MSVMAAARRSEGSSTGVLATIVAALRTAAVIPVIPVCALAAGAAAQDGAPKPGPPPDAAPPALPGSEVFTLRSPAFGDGTRIPDRHTVEGEDLSPPLEWSGAPPETKSFAVICEDIDVRGGRPWVHWVIYAIPGDAKGLPAGVPRERELEEPIVARQGTNSWSKDNAGYRGPATPRGDKPHRYRFTVYALKAVPDARAGLNAAALRHRIKDLILAEASIIGTYSRAKNPGETPPGVQERELPPRSPSAPGEPGGPGGRPRPGAGAPSLPPRKPPPSGGRAPSRGDG